MSKREKFEKWISSLPYKAPIERFPNNDDDDNEHSFYHGSSFWPGSYTDISVSLAWEAWQIAKISIPTGEKCGYLCDGCGKPCPTIEDQYIGDENESNSDRT